MFISKFPIDLRKADVIPVHKKKVKTSIANYRPISILPTLSKIYETWMYDEIYSYFNSEYQCEFRQGNSTQNCLLPMIEKCESLCRWRQIGRAILTDLSRTFDCINHNLLIAKLAAYGFRYESLNFMRGYLTDRKQRIRSNYTYSFCSNVTCCITQGFILSPFLFNIDICDMFLLNSSFDIASYADVNTPYFSCLTKDLVKTKLEISCINFFQMVQRTPYEI